MRTLSLLFVMSSASLAIAQPEPPPPDLPIVRPTPMKLPPPEKTAPEPPPAPNIDISYDNGLKFEQDDGNYGLKIAFRNQLRFETTRPTEDNSQFESHFLIPRARLQIEGHVFGKDTRYKLELGLQESGSYSFVKDLFVEQRLSTAPVWLRAGIWKRPFNRQEIVSDYTGEFNERAITANFVGGGRDIGLGFHNDYEKSPEGLEWAVGVFNEFSGGEERPDIGGCTTDMAGATACPPPRNFPADFAPAIAARLGWNDGDVKGYAEGDLDGGPLRWGVAAAYKIDLANFAKGAEDSVKDNLSHGLEIDAMFKVEGASIELGAYMMILKSADAGFGALAQVGYMIVPKRVELAGRFAVAPDDDDADRNQIEARLAFSLFWHGHAWKLVTDAGILKTTGEDAMTMATDKPDLVLRTMLQLTL